MSQWGNVQSGKCPSGNCPIGELSVRGNVHRGSFRRGSVSRGIVLGEVSVGELSSRGTVRIPEQILKLICATVKCQNIFYYFFCQNDTNNIYRLTDPVSHNYELDNICQLPNEKWKNGKSLHCNQNLILHRWLTQSALLFPEMGLSQDLHALSCQLMITLFCFLTMLPLQSFETSFNVFFLTTSY